MWSIQLLGGLSAHNLQRQVSRFRTQKAASLLAYLAFHRSPQPRETLIALLWPDAEIETGRHNLSMALSFLRHQLEPPGIPPGTVILADRFSVRLNHEAVSTDVQQFENLMRQAGQPQRSEGERLTLLQQAADLYTGSLLLGFYEEWIGPEALRLESRFVQVVGQLVSGLLQRGKAELALEYAQRALSADPLSEEAARQVMQVLAALGQPAQAQRVYRSFAQRLQEELDAQPSSALQRLAERLEASGPLSTSSALTESASPPEAAYKPAFTRELHPPPPPTADGVDYVHAAPQARLQGSEFLLRTTTRFFDREAETARLSEMLSSPRARLVTLMGPGGIGKTRLALEAAAHWWTPQGDERLPISVVFVPLADIDEPGRLFELILRVMGVVPAAELAPLDQLVQVLASQPATLLLLDNFEQLVVEGALLVRELLARADTVKLLVTSRQKLDLQGEREFHLAPLPTPTGAQDPQELLQVASIGLFVDRAQSARPDFQLTERNAAEIAQLCDRLEGIPLAIELAASRVALLSPARILEQVKANRLDFLTTRKRDASSRQRTLRATLDWSYHLLPPTGQAFLMQLSVFRGGWTLEAAKAVCEVKQGETLDLLMLLRDSSLIGVVDTEEGLRFTLLETIRQYSREKLQESGESEAVLSRHGAFFLALAEQTETHLTGSEQVFWLQRLETEHENLRAALEWSLNAGNREQGTGDRKDQPEEQSKIENRESETALRLAAALWRFWWVRGHWNAARSYLLEALQQTGTASTTQTRAKALYGAGMLANSQGDYSSAAEAFEDSLAIYRERGDRGGMAAALNGLGHVTKFLGDHAAAQSYYEQSLAIHRERGDKEAIAVSLNYLGDVAAFYGDYGLARRRLEESLAIRRELGDKGGVGDSLIALANIAREQANYEQARALCEQSLAIFQELGDRSRMANARHLLGIIAENEGDLARARGIGEENLGLFQEIGDRTQVAWTLHGLGYLAYRQGDFREAHSLLMESLSMFRAMTYPFGILRTLDRLAGLAVAQGQMARAVRLLGAVKALLDVSGVEVAVSEQKENESYETSARSVLGLKAFTEEWEAGQAMTLEQAIEYALEENTAA